MAEQPERKRTKRVVPASASLPPGYDIADVAAFQALQRGDASADMQRRALKWLIERAAGTYDLSYRQGGEEGRRDTDFAEGRRFVGLQVVKFLRLNLAMLRRDEPLADPPEPRE